MENSRFSLSLSFLSCLLLIDEATVIARFNKAEDSLCIELEFRYILNHEWRSRVVPSKANPVGNLSYTNCGLWIERVCWNGGPFAQPTVIHAWNNFHLMMELLKKSPLVVAGGDNEAQTHEK